MTASRSPTATPGELVFSTVTREALPLLRYRTGDIASLRRGTCACGRTLVKMSKVTGRRDDMLVIRGVNVYPSEVERVLLADPWICPDYLLVVDEREAAGAAHGAAANTRRAVLDRRAPGRMGRHGAGPAEAELEHRLRDGPRGPGRGPGAVRRVRAAQ